MQIDDYKPKQEVVEKFISSNFVVIAGPAAAGKDTLRNGLINKYKDLYEPIISTTTRSPRPDEQEGEAYHFISVEQIKTLIEEGNLLQVALVHNQQISATDSAELEKLSSSKTGLSILVVQTEAELYALNSKIKTIFLIPPSYNELLKRLELERQTKHHEVSRRLAAAVSEIEIALNLDRYFCIISDERERVIEAAHNFLQSGLKDEEEDVHAREVMQKILEDLKQSKVS